MKPLYTTLNEIRANCPCESSWRTLLKGLGKTKADGRPLRISRILRICGFWDAMWVLDCTQSVSTQSVKERSRRYMRIYRKVGDFNSRISNWPTWSQKRERTAIDILDGKR